MRKEYNIKIGQKYNRLTIISEAYRREDAYKLFLKCRCQCGNIIEISKRDLTSNRKRSCGCLPKYVKYRFEIGSKFKNITFLSDSYRDEELKCRVVNGRCECGHEEKIHIEDIYKDKKLCSVCYPRQKVNLLGISNQKICKIWYGMKNRCLKPNCKEYKYYGERGIKICEEWLNLENFLSWSYGHGYREGLSLDRIDPDGDYHPLNCEWVTRSENTTRMNNYYKQKLLNLELENQKLQEKIKLFENLDINHINGVIKHIK